MHKKAVLVILAVLVSLLLQASGEVNVNINVPGHSMGGASSQEAIIAELQDRMKDMELQLFDQKVDLTDKLIAIQEQNLELTDKLTDMATELWLYKKSFSIQTCCNKTLVCPSGYIQFLDRCYGFSTEEKNYTNAKSACQAAGGHLAMPKDKPTNDFLVKQISTKNVPGIYIGLTDLVTEGTFVFDDGTPLSWSNWGQGQPSAQDPNYDCVGLAMISGHQGQWATGFCATEATYVCEVSATVST
ncbi:tetranectin-like protein [Branchiostoma floridae x Branchiostoma belcheri]